jgi:hypothetical protein
VLEAAESVEAADTMHGSAYRLLRNHLLRDSVNRRFGFASHTDDDFSLSVSFSDITNSFRDLA